MLLDNLNGIIMTHLNVKGNIDILILSKSKMDDVFLDSHFSFDKHGIPWNSIDFVRNDITLFFF